jgi:hypothetical protein
MEWFYTFASRFGGREKRRDSVRRMLKRGIKEKITHYKVVTERV